MLWAKIEYFYRVGRNIIMGYIIYIQYKNYHTFCIWNGDNNYKRFDTCHRYVQDLEVKYFKHGWTICKSSWIKIIQIVNFCDFDSELNQGAQMFVSGSNNKRLNGALKVVIFFIYS